MKKMLLVAVGVAGLALASGKSYNFTVLEPVLPPRCARPAWS